MLSAAAHRYFQEFFSLQPFSRCDLVAPYLNHFSRAERQGFGRILFTFIREAEIGGVENGSFFIVIRDAG